MIENIDVFFILHQHLFSTQFPLFLRSPGENAPQPMVKIGFVTLVLICPIACQSIVFSQILNKIFVVT